MPGSKEYFSAAQALAHIAFHDSEAFAKTPAGLPDMVSLWGYSTSTWTEGRRTPPLFLMRWVWARVRWRLTRERHGKLWRRCPLQPLVPQQRAILRQVLRQHRQPATELIPRLRHDIESARLATARHLESLQRADQALREALAADRLAVYGRRGDASAEEFFSQDHEPVPPLYFLNEDRTIELEGEGWAALGEHAPLTALLEKRTVNVPDWGDLRFPVESVLRCFPASASANPAPSSQEKAVAWMQQAYAGERKPKRLAAIADCQKETGATFREARWAIDQVKDRPRRGRPRPGHS